MKKLTYVLMVGIVTTYANQEVMQISVAACDKVKSQATTQVCLGDSCQCTLRVAVTPTKSGSAHICCTVEGNTSEQPMGCECTMSFGSTIMTKLCDDCPVVITLKKSPDCSVSVCKVDAKDADKCPVMCDSANECCNKTPTCCNETTC